MKELLVLLIVGAVFYFINRGYRSEDYQYIQTKGKQPLKGKLEDHEAGLLIAMMAKVAKADGKVSELEAEILSHTFTDIANHFENSEEIRAQLKVIYSNEKESFENTVVIAKRYLKLTKRDYNKRIKVLEYLLNLAFIDGDFSETEFMITEDIANALEIKKTDFEAIVRQFEHYYASKENNKQLSLEKAYEILGVDAKDEMGTIKKRYRELVKENHPDIVTGQGAEQSIIDQATKKLQEINEAYELIKNSRK